MNDTVLHLDGVAVDSRLGGPRINRLAFPEILRMGQELFAHEPLLQRTNLERARRLGLLIAAKAPMINAALFVAPSLDCRPADVTVRFLICEFEVMAALFTHQKAGALDAVTADKLVWRRMAA